MSLYLCLIYLYLIHPYIHISHTCFLCPSYIHISHTCFLCPSPSVVNIEPMLEGDYVKHNDNDGHVDTNDMYPQVFIFIFYILLYFFMFSHFLCQTLKQGRHVDTNDMCPQIFTLFFIFY